MSKAGHTPPSTYVVADTRTETAPDEIELSGSVSASSAAVGSGICMLIVGGRVVSGDAAEAL